VLRDPAAVSGNDRVRALAGFASLLTDAPWTVDAGDLGRLRAAGLRDDEIVQTVTIVAVFNHLTRVADGTAIEFDYTTQLAEYEVDRTREPLPRPDPSEWPRPEPRLPLSLRPDTAAALAAWRAFAFTPDAGLSARDRAVIARATAHHLCDAAGVAEHADAVPASAREAALAGYAEKLTLSPWRMTASDLAPLRAEGLDDRGLLHAIALVGHQNAASRVRLALG
jgi:alkylhydroperoxidase family enzyme